MKFLFMLGHKVVGRKISKETLSGGGGGATEKDQQIAKKTKNSTIKPLFTISVPCMNIQGGVAPLPPTVVAHAWAVRSGSCSR